MAPSLFFSYSHPDESLRDQLEVHLAGLKRQGLISAWHDRKITAGTEIDNSISANLEAASIILLLVSPDFINSDYCYEREMKRAMERHEAKEARVIPVILRPSDWHNLSFGKLLGAPKDGKAITTWPNLDEAFLNVVQSIKDALKEMQPQTAAPAAAPLPRAGVTHPAPGTLSWAGGVHDVLGGPRSSNLRIRKQFTELDLDRFLQEGFEFLANFFQNTMQELVNRNPGLDQRFQRINATHFTAAVYQDGRKVCKGSAAISSGHRGQNSIEYAMDDAPRFGGINEIVYVKNDDQSLYFEASGMQMLGNRSNEKLTSQGAAERLWELFIKPLQ